MNTLIEMKESLEAARLRVKQKDEQKEGTFQQLLIHRKQMILKALAPPPFLKAAKSPTSLDKSILSE